MGTLYGCARRLTAQNGGFWPGQFTNFVPTNFSLAVRVRDVLAAPLAGVAGAVPLKVSNPLVEASLIMSQKGAVITLVNWSENIARWDAKPYLHVTVELTVPLDLRRRRLPSLAAGYSRRGRSAARYMQPRGWCTSSWTWRSQTPSFCADNSLCPPDFSLLLVAAIVKLLCRVRLSTLSLSQQWDYF
jgi:hypothetical protein